MTNQPFKKNELPSNKPIKPTTLNRGSHNKTNALFSRTTGWITTIVAFGVGRYVGVYFFIPLVGAIGSYFLLRRVRSKNNPIIALAASVQSGHLIWLIVGAIYIGSGGFLQIGLDATILLVGIIWLVIKPSKPPLVFLGLYQVFSLAVNVVRISSSGGQPDNIKALIVHILLRLVALTLMFLAFKEPQKGLGEPTKTTNEKLIA